MNYVRGSLAGSAKDPGIVLPRMSRTDFQFSRKFPNSETSRDHDFRPRPSSEHFLEYSRDDEGGN